MAGDGKHEGQRQLFRPKQPPFLSEFQRDHTHASSNEYGLNACAVKPLRRVKC